MINQLINGTILGWHNIVKLHTLKNISIDYLIYLSI